MIKLEDFDPLVADLQAQTLVVDLRVALEGTPVVAITVDSGEDENVDDRVTAGPSIGTLSVANGGSGVANAAIYFQLSALRADVNYLLVYSCDAGNGDTPVAFNHIRGIEPE